MENENLIIKNKKTGLTDIINQRELEVKDWGFSFFVDSESEAYKAAYSYRNSPHGVEVQWAGGAEEWMVTVFNEFAVKSGIDGAK